MIIGTQELFLLIIPIVVLIIYVLNRLGFSVREGPPIELDKLKDKSNRFSSLLGKLEERFASGEISEDQYKRLSGKYKTETENIKNKIIEKELIYDAGIEESDSDEIKYDNQEKKGDITSAFLWMLFLSIILFWAPVIGPLLAGFVGGRKAGGIGNAILAALLPAIIIFFIFTTIMAPLFNELLGPLGMLLGTAIGGTMGIIVLIDSTVLIIGAIVGAITV